MPVDSVAILIDSVSGVSTFKKFVQKDQKHQGIFVAFLKE